MNAMPWRAISAGLLFLFLFLTGYWLGHLGKPLSVIPFNVHKLIGLGALIFLIVTAYQLNHTTRLGSSEIIALVISVLLFIVTMVAGGLVSLETPMPAGIVLLHKVLPYGTALSSAIALYLLLH